MAAEAMALRFSSRHRGSLLLAGLGLAVFGARCAWIALAGAHVPAFDQWLGEGQGLLFALLEGDRISVLVAPHNEHRVFTAKLVTLGLFLVNGYWDVEGGLVVSAAAKAAEMVLLFRVLRPARGGTGLLVILLAAGALPLSPFNLLSGLQISFTLMEIASVLALLLLLGRRTLDGDRVAAAGVCLFLAFFSLATGALVPVAIAVVLGLQARAEGRTGRDRLALLALLACFAGFGVLLTPVLDTLLPQDPQRMVGTLVRCLAFPLGNCWSWALLSHLPLLVLAGRLIRGRAAVEPRAWLILGLGIWTLTLQVALAVGRGGWGGPLRPPSEQHFEFLALPLAWNYLALLALASRGPWRWLPPLWVFWSLVLLGWHSVTYSWPTLRKEIQEAPLADTRLRQALSGDWRAVSEQAERVTERGLRHDDGFLYEPEGRHAIPPSVLNILVHSPELLRILPPALRGRGFPSLTARFLQGLAGAWPASLSLGLALLVLGVRHDPEAAVPGPP